MKNTLHGETVQGWNLVPCKENIEKFQFAEPKEIEKIEDRFPQAWKYLRRHVEQLRGREKGRYAEGKPEGHLWYGAARPQNLSYYFRPKLVLQVLSRRPSIALDLKGRFVFTAGGTAGVYGIVPKITGEDHLLCVAAILNSKVADFCVKQISSVFGSRFYSYGDQFIEKIPVPTRVNNFQLLSKWARAIIACTEKHSGLDRKISEFPQSFERELSRYELDIVARLCTGHPHSAQLDIDQDSISVEQGLYGFGVRFSVQQAFEFEDREHAECLAQALRSRDRATLPLKEVLQWRLPLKAEGCKRLLALLDQTKGELENLRGEIAEEDQRLNELVYEIYKITPDERKVIEAFLDRFTSKAAMSSP